MEIERKGNLYSAGRDSFELSGGGGGSDGGEDNGGELHFESGCWLNGKRFKSGVVELLR